MKKISTTNAPAAVGPYSQGVESNGFLFVSGQLPVTMATGEMETDIKKATYACLANVKAIVEEAGFTMNNVVKATVFMKDFDQFAEMNEVYADFFDGHAPARAAFQVSRLPKDAVVEIEAIVAK